MEECDPKQFPQEPRQQDVASDESDSISRLQREKDELAAQLRQVVAVATENERIWRHFVEIERILFRTRELGQLVEELLQEIKLRFRPDQVVLLLSHPDILDRFFPEITQESKPVGQGTWIFPLAPEETNELFAEPPKPILLSLDAIHDLPSFLPRKAPPIQSGVLMPLCIHHVFFGGLFLGSADAARYRPGDGTDLLEQLAAKIALCMDNCLSYERVKEFALHEPMSGLLNVFQAHAVLEKEFRKARRSGAGFSVLLVSPQFYQENNGLSDIANQVLQHVADLLREILPEDDCALGRYGSDEFVVILPGVQEEEAREVIAYLAPKIRKAPFQSGRTAILIQPLIGVGSLSPNMRRPEELLDAASAELWHLKMRHSGVAAQNGSLSNLPDLPTP